MSTQTSSELNHLRQQLMTLQRDNARLTREAGLFRERMQEAERYRFLFETMEEGFCVIQFIDGPNGPMSDYVHLMANPAYSRHAGLPDVVGRTLRQVIPDEAEVWLKHFGEVARTGEPVYFEHDLYATDRCLALSALRLEPAEQRLVAVIFRDATARKRAENALQKLNEQLEQRVNQAMAERIKAEEALRQAQKWRRSANSPEASPMTSTTCLAASSAHWSWPKRGWRTSALMPCLSYCTAPTARPIVQPPWSIDCWPSPDGRRCYRA